MAISLFPVVVRCYINVIYASLTVQVYLQLFVLPLLPLKCAKSREIPRKFELIAVQGHPSSSTLVPIESAYATSFYSLIVTLDVSRTVSEIFISKNGVNLKPVVGVVQGLENGAI